jgi:hypothetical protein
MKSTAWKSGNAGSWQDASNWTNGVPDDGDTAVVLGAGSSATNLGTIVNVNLEMAEGTIVALGTPQSAFDNKGTMLASNGKALGIGWGGYGVGMTPLSAGPYGTPSGQTIYNEGLIAGSVGATLDFSSGGDVYGTYSHFGMLSNSGTIDANGAHVVINADITQTATGVIEIDNGGSMDVGAYIVGGLLKLNSGYVDFGLRGGHGDLGRSIAAAKFGSNVEFDGPASLAFPEPLTRLDLDPAADTLTVRGVLGTTNDFTLATLHLTGTYTADEFTISPDQQHVLFTASAPPAPPPVSDPPPAPPAGDPPPVGTSPPPVVTPPPAAPMNFAVLDTTTNTPMNDNGSAYTGPVSGLNWQYMNLSPSNLNVVANVPNAFIHSGAGEDALNVSVASGNNVLDGSTGSNFLVGGAGQDTFFLDDRGPAAALWDTLVNFHSGDSATVWGLTANDFQVQTADGQGAGGFAGLTFHFTGGNQPTASLTLTGYNSGSLSNGQLSMSYGRTGDLPGLPGSDYLSIHAA